MANSKGTVKNDYAVPSFNLSEKRKFASGEFDD